MTVSPAGNAPLPLPSDDAVVVFRTDASGVLGRLVRLGSVADTIIRAHASPDVASIHLGDVLASAAMLGSAMSEDGGTLSIQTRTDGAVRTLYADCQAPGKLRGYVRAEAEHLPPGARLTGGEALGAGHLAITHDPGSTAERYQGVIAIEGLSLGEALQSYFRDRENLPTFVRLASAQHFVGSAQGLPSDMRWRAGGLMLQAGGTADSATENDNWNRVCTLAATLEDHELLDPAISAERLLLRLFHEEGVRIDKVVSLQTYCKCARGRVLNVLKTFGPAELADMRDAQGQISAKCEFCAATYVFDLAEIATPPEGGAR